MQSRFLALACLLGCGGPTTGAVASPQRLETGLTASVIADDAPRPEAPGYHYSFAVDEGLTTLRAEVCFVGGVPDRLAPPMGAAVPFISGATHGERTLAIDDGIDLRGVEDGDCVHYAVDLSRVFEEVSSWDGVARVGDDALLSPDWWLWPPEPRPEGVPIRARFHDGVGVSVPWPVDQQGGFTHRIPESCFVWKAQAAFGQLEEHELQIPTARFHLSVLGDGFGGRTGAVTNWVRDSAQVAADLLGRFPVDRAQVLMVADARGSSFGLALRGGGPTAVLLVPNAPSDADLAQDWTGVHELLHFAHPPMATAEAWFYEGVVTYLTPVARARAGDMTEEAAWTELFDGYHRGHHRSGTGLPLHEESRRMHETRAYWRVYWAGAAIALMWDVELHRQGRSLAETMRSMVDLRLDTTRKWTGRQLAAKLDAACHCDVHQRIAEQHLDRSEFPELRPYSRALGIRYTPGKGLDGAVALDAKAPEATLRQQIMGAANP